MVMMMMMKMKMKTIVKKMMKMTLGSFSFWKESLAGAFGNAYGVLGLFPHVSSWALETKLFQIIEACSTLAQQGKLTQNS
jgi:hypothetical protein